MRGESVAIRGGGGRERVPGLGASDGRGEQRSRGDPRGRLDSGRGLFLLPRTLGTKIRGLGVHGVG